MSESNIWMPLYIGDYLADTQLLTTEQHGAYLLLIMAYWKNQGPLPNNDEILASVCKLTPAKWKKIKPVVLKFFKAKGGELTHKRIDQELKTTKEKRQKASDKARAAAKKRWEEEAKKNAPSNATSSATSSAPSNPQSNAPRYANHSHSHNHLPNPPVPGDEPPSDSERYSVGLVDPESGEILRLVEGG